MTVSWRSELLREVARLSELARRGPLNDVDALLSSLTEGSLRVVTSATYAGTTTTPRKGPLRTVSATHPCVALLGEIERRHTHGPCLSASGTQQWIRIGDLADESRWPAFSRDAAMETPIRSVMTFHCVADRHVKVALSFYSEELRAFDDVAVELGQICATHVALAWNVARRDGQFRAALASRDVIGQAKGMLMERFNIDAVQAFELLKRLSQSSNVPLATVADRLITAEHSSS